MALNKKKLMGLLALLLDDEEEEKPSPAPRGLIPSFLGEDIERPRMVPIGPARPQPNTGNPRDSMVPLINWQGSQEGWNNFLENWRRGGAGPQAPVAPGADRHPPMPFPGYDTWHLYNKGNTPIGPSKSRLHQEFDESRGFVDSFPTLGGLPPYSGIPQDTYLDYTEENKGPGIVGSFDNYEGNWPWSPEDAAWWGDPEDQSIQQIKGPVGRETDERYGRVTPEGIVPLRDTPGGVANEDRGNPFLTAQGVVDPETGQRRVSTPVGQPIPQPNEEVGFMDREISDHGQKMRNVMEAYYGGADFGYEEFWPERLGVTESDIENFMGAMSSGDIDYAMQNPTDFVLEEFERKWGWPLEVNADYWQPEIHMKTPQADIDEAMEKYRNNPNSTWQAYENARLRKKREDWRR